MDVSDALELNIPVLEGTWDGDRVRVFCNACFAFHFHGSGGIKVPHCLFSARWYYIQITEDLPDAYGYMTPAGSWRIRCDRGRWHRSRYLGRIERPHVMTVQAAPPPGSPVRCVVTGTFYDLLTGDEAPDPGYSDRDRARFGYLESDPLLSG